MREIWQCTEIFWQVFNTQHAKVWHPAERRDTQQKGVTSVTMSRRDRGCHTSSFFALNSDVVVVSRWCQDLDRDTPTRNVTPRQKCEIQGWHHLEYIDKISEILSKTRPIGDLVEASVWSTVRSQMSERDLLVHGYLLVSIQNWMCERVWLPFKKCDTQQKRVTRITI